MQETKDIQPLNVHIAVENFGPIEKAEVDLRPLTVFVGESNTGKTYLAALIYALHQHFEGFSRFPWSYRTGSMASFIYRSRIHSSQIEAELEEEIAETLEKLNTFSRPFKFSDLPNRICSRLEYNLKKSDLFQEELIRCFDLESLSHLRRFIGTPCDELKVSLKVCEENQLLWFFNMHHSDTTSTAEGSINGDMILKFENSEVQQETLDLSDLAGLLRVSRRETANSYYLPAARSGIMQSHGVIASSLLHRTNRVGLERFREIPTFSGMIIDFLDQVTHYERRRMSSDEMIIIANTLEEEVLRGEIEVSQPTGFGYPQFLYRPQKVEQTLRMSQSSSMVSELAPLVYFLRAVVKPNDTLIIEEPESHLHPKAQTQIAITLARLVRAGVRVIITTHSDWLLQQIGNLIREGELREQEEDTTELPHWLSKEEVGAWWFHADKPVQEIPYDRIEGIEPRDYEDVADGLYNNFVELERQFLEEEE